MTLDKEVVRELANELRIEAESALARVETELKAGKAAIFAQAVGAYYRALQECGRVVALEARLTALRARYPNDPVIAKAHDRVLALLTVFAAMQAGWVNYVREATPAEREGKVEVGAPPVGVIIIVAIAGVAVLAVSLTGVAWAVVHLQQARNLSEQISAVENDPSLAEKFKQLNESAPNGATVNPVGGGEGGGGGGLLLGLAAAAAALVGGFVLFARGGR